MGRMAWGAVVLGMWGCVLACSGATEANGPPGGSSGNAGSGTPNTGTSGQNAGGSGNPAGMSGAAGKPSGAGGSGSNNSNLGGGSSVGGQVSVVAGAAGNGGGGGTACTPQDAPTTDPGSGSCPTFTACGGDLTGKWNIALTCADPAVHSYSVLCTGGTDTTDVSGTLEFKADGTYLAQAAVHTQGTVPQSCLTQFQASCGDNPFEGCVPSGAGCTCDYRSPPQPAEAGWTWQANGNVLGLSHECQTEFGHFCVQGNELQFRARTADNRYFVYRGTRQ